MTQQAERYKELEQSVRVQLLNDRKYMALKAKYDKEWSNGNIAGAINARTKMESYYQQKRREAYEKECEEYLSMRECYERMEKADADRLRLNACAMSAMVDQLDMFIRNMDDVLRKYGFTLTMFKGMDDYHSKVKNVMHHFDNEHEEQGQLWADMMDSMEKYIYMRAGAYIKKDDKIAARKQREENIRQCLIMNGKIADGD